MALGGLLAGLAQSSKQWPGAIQNRMLLQQKAEERQAEAERLEQERVQQQNNAIYERIKYLAEHGETGPVKEAVAALPQTAIPGLAEALIGIAEDAAFQYNQESDERTIDNQYRQAQTDALSNPKWQSRTGSQFLYRTDPKTGKLEQTLGPSPDPKPPKVLKLIASAGAILNEDGSTTLISDENVRDAIMNSARTRNPATKIENGLVWYQDGSSRQWTNQERDIYFDFEEQKPEQSFARFKEREDYKNEHLLNRYAAQAEIQLNSEQITREWDRLEKQSESIVEIFNIQLGSLQKKYENPERALENSRKMLENAGVSSQRITDLLQEWEPVYNSYAFDFDLTSQQANMIIENRGIQVSADKIHELLKNGDVKRHVGVLKGRFEDIRRDFKGGKDTPQSVIDFRFELNNMVDAVRRARTGAAISETETHFYNDLLGTTRYDPDYLQGLMGTIVSSINAQSEDQYKALFSQKYGRPPVASELSDMNARLMYQTDIGGGSKNTRVNVSVDEAKQEQNEKGPG